MDGLDSLARPWVGSGEKKRQSPGRPGPDRQWSRPLSQPLHCHATPQVLCAFHPVGSFGQEARSRLAPVNITSLPCCRCCSGSALRCDACTPPRAVIPHSPFPKTRRRQHKARAIPTSVTRCKKPPVRAVAISAAALPLSPRHLPLPLPLPHSHQQPPPTASFRRLRPVPRNPPCQGRPPTCPDPRPPTPEPLDRLFPSIMNCAPSISFCVSLSLRTR